MGKETVICRKCGKVIQETSWGKIKKDKVIYSVHKPDCESYNDVKADRGPDG